MRTRRYGTPCFGTPRPTPLYPTSRWPLRQTPPAVYYYLSDGAGIAYAVLDASGTAVKVRPLSSREVRQVGGLDPPGYG